MTAPLRAVPFAALLGAWAALPPSPALPAKPVAVDALWTSGGFAERLRSAAELATSELRGAPEVAWADVRVRSIDDHAPLRVEASVAWSAAVSADRKGALLSTVRGRFESFACVDVVLAEEKTR